MGFLLGAYGKLAAGSRYRSLQARMMRIQSRIRRATRDVANMEKMLDRNMKAELQNLTNSSNATKAAYQNTMQTALYSSSTGLYQAALSAYYKDGAKDGYVFKPDDTGKNDITIKDSNVAQAMMQQITQEQSKFNTQVSSMTAWMDQNVSVMKQEIENRYEMLRDTMLEPLKDEEDSLQLEKDTLESQIQVAKADYEACQKMEQADVKMLTPNYTGGQG